MGNEAYPHNHLGDFIPFYFPFFALSISLLLFLFYCSFTPTFSTSKDKCCDTTVERNISGIKVWEFIFHTHIYPETLRFESSSTEEWNIRMGPYYSQCVDMHSPTTLLGTAVHLFIRAVSQSCGCSAICKNADMQAKSSNSSTIQIGKIWSQLLWLWHGP